MYRSFYGLSERPFDLTSDPRFIVLTDGHREALSNLAYGIDSRKGITLLLGEAGSGKTTIIRAALDRQGRHVHAVYVHNPALTRVEFNEMLAHKFGLSEAARASKTVLLMELEQLLRERDARRETTLLVVDEAQTLSRELLEEIRLLANIETNDDKLLSVVLAGQPELADRLNDADLRQLKQRVALRCELKPLTLLETFGYVAGRIAKAGGKGAELFTREAVVMMHERSHGLPRTISVIADNALVSGFALGQKPVKRDIVDEVCRDFDLMRGASVTEPSFPAEGPPPAAEPVLSSTGVTTGSASADAAAGTRLLDARPAEASTAKAPMPGHGPADSTATPSADAKRPGLFGAFNKKRRSFFSFARQG